jgi:DNA-binding response OmpR family regulator
MAKKRLLVIEDDADVAEMLVVYFSDQGYEVLHAMTGSEGVAMARAKFPNLVLLDVMLPDMDGFDVCRLLRTTTLTKFIPITFLTQRDGRSDKVTGLTSKNCGCGYKAPCGVPHGKPFRMSGQGWRQVR